MKRILSCFLAAVTIVTAFAFTSINASANQSRYYNFADGTYSSDPATYMVNIAMAQVNKTGSQLGYTEGWCDNFVSDCAIKAGQASAIPQGGDVNDFLYKLINAGAVQVSSPQAGDVVIFYCTSDGSYCHAGLMVDSTRSIQGNVNNQVLLMPVTDYRDSHYLDATGGTCYTVSYYRPAYGGSSPYVPDSGSVSVNWTLSSDHYFVADTNACLSTSFSISGADYSAIQYCGCHIYDYKGAWLQGNDTKDTYHLGYNWCYYDVNNELYTTLAPGTLYYYCFDLVINGTVYYSPKYSFTTTGTHTHNYEGAGIVTIPNCTESSYVTHTCTTCGYTYDTFYADPIGHNWNADYTIDCQPTCTTEGSKSIHCSRCDATKDTEVIPATAHTPVIDAAVAPTETETGLTEGSHCSVCGTVITAQEVIPATGTTEPDQAIDPDQPADTTDVTVKFTDVPAGKWYVPYIQFAIDNEFMSGSGATTFDPNGHTSRAMFVQILYAMAGKPDVTGLTCPFTDVPEGKWYYKAVVWAYNNSVTSGTSATTFGTNDDVTREQVALLLYAYYGRPEVSGELEGFADINEVSSWSYTALVWATRNGIMSGSKEGTSLLLQPKNGATRAVTATMMTGFYKLTHTA